MARKIANDFRNRRVERGLTREDVAEKSGVALANITRFEQKAPHFTPKPGSSRNRAGLPA